MIRRAAISIFMAGQLLAAAGYAQPDPAARPAVNFNFDQVEVRFLVKIVGDITGKRFVVDDDIDGKVTVVTPTQIPVDEVYPLFLSIMESTGYSIVEQGAVHHLVSLPERVIPGAPVISTGDAAPDGGIITKVIKLNHVSALEVRKILEPMVAGGKDGALAAVGATNHLIITDTAENIARLEKILGELDQAGQSRTTEVMKLEFASAGEVAQEINRVLQGQISANEKLSRHMLQVTEGAGGLPTSISVVAAAHANKLILVGTPVQLQDMKSIIQEMDVEAPAGAGRLNAIFLKYLPAEDAAVSLNALLAKTVPANQRSSIAIEPSIANNALLVEASAADFKLVRNLVEQLDQVPQQVLVEILVAEMASGENLDLGVELATIEIPNENDTTVLGRSRPGEVNNIANLFTNFLPQGLTFALSEGTFTDPSGNILPRVPFLIRALAQDREVEILANVPLWAQNNREASVSVVDNIPIVTSNIEGSGSARDVIQTIERLDVGIEMKLTPQVNADGQIQLELNPTIEAIVDQGPEGQLFAPTITRREVTTTVTIPNRSTVVISGLIREDSIESASKIPLLGDIPLLGFLFRSTSERKQRTNLLIFVTPTIVTDMAEAQAAVRDLEERTGLALPNVRLNMSDMVEE